MTIFYYYWITKGGDQDGSLEENPREIRGTSDKRGSSHRRAYHDDWRIHFTLAEVKGRISQDTCILELNEKSLSVSILKVGNLLRMEKSQNLASQVFR